MRWPIAWRSPSAPGSRSTRRERGAGSSAPARLRRRPAAPDDARSPGRAPLMQIAANGIALEVEDHGSPQGEPLLLIMGLGMQLLGWHEDLVALLVARGFRVIRFDNRDIGLSQGFDAAGVPNLALDSLRHALGLRVKSPYTLRDMAADAVGVLDALGIASAHVCGASMGGMIAQRMAEIAPQRIRSLTLMMTSSGARGLPGPTLRVRSAMIA